MLIGLVAVPYFLLVAVPWVLNPFIRIVPRAYEIPGLVAVTIVVVAASAFNRALRLQLLGARRQRIVAMVTVLAGFSELAVVIAASAIGAFVAPIADGAATLMAILVFSLTLRHVYQLPSSGQILTNPDDSGW